MTRLRMTVAFGMLVWAAVDAFRPMNSPRLPRGFQVAEDVVWFTLIFFWPQIRSGIAKAARS